MEYFKINFKKYRNVGRVPSYANGDNILNAEFYSNKISQGEILLETPIFDCFFLESFDNKEYWEWYLSDVYEFTKEWGRTYCWLISTKLQQVLSNYVLTKPYHFYPSQLLYKGKKLDYYLFQFVGKSIYKQTTEYIDYKKSKFLNPYENIIVNFENNDDYARQSDVLYFKTKKDFIKQEIVLKEDFDFFPMQSFLKDNLVSEKLKNAIEENGIEGFEFSELDYEVVVEN